MTIKIGVPSKGRLRKNVLEVFKKNKYNLISERGERDYFAKIKNKRNIKIVYLHAREIIERLSDQSLDIGFSGFDLLKETSKKIQNKIIGRRKIEEILNRFNKKIKDPRKFSEGKKTASIIREYLKISCPINLARYKLNSFFLRHKIKINIKDEFFPLKNNLGIIKIIFSTNFGRELEYYTGMVFNIKNQSNTNLIQGGRYDNLLSNLGANRKIPAVGAAINLNSYDN